MLALAVVLDLFLSSAAQAAGQPAKGPELSIVEAEKCPVRIQAAAIEPGSATGLRIRYSVSNPHGQKISRVVVTAATISRSDRVTAVRVQTVEEPVEPRGRSEQFVVFPKLTPAPGERVVFGVQAVGWADGREWRGNVRLVSATEPKTQRE